MSTQDAAESATSPLLEAHQIWRLENLAARWGLDPSQLGCKETGVGMADHGAVMLPLPEKSKHLDYCRRAFQALEHAAHEQAELAAREADLWLAWAKVRVEGLQALLRFQALTPPSSPLTPVSGRESVSTETPAQ